MKMNIGSVTSAFHFIAFIAAPKARSTNSDPVPQSSNAEMVATEPMAPNTRWPVASISIIDTNMRIAISSYGIQLASPWG